LSPTTPIASALALPISWPPETACQSRRDRNGPSAGGNQPVPVPGTTPIVPVSLCRSTRSGSLSAVKSPPRTASTPVIDTGSTRGVPSDVRLPGHRPAQRVRPTGEKSEGARLRVCDQVRASVPVEVTDAVGTVVVPGRRDHDWAAEGGLARPREQPQPLPGVARHQVGVAVLVEVAGRGQPGVAGVR